jgi:putative two-component system response regulator
MTQRTPSKARILVVDDLVENTELLANFLKPKGYDVETALDGPEALNRVDLQAPDVILLDLVMPEMSGFEVCQILKQDPRTRHIPIIVVSGLGERDANVRAIEAGADDFLVKPFDAVLLQARIRSSLRTKLLHDQIFEYQDQLESNNMTLEDCVRQRTAQVEQTQQVTVFTLAKLAESRDSETGQHLERMRCYAREVADEIITLPKYADAFDTTFAEQIYQSSPLHDIGKVGVPDRILLKPGKLSFEEFEIMKSHATIGGDTLKLADEQAGKDSFLSMGRDIAYSHHEKWDGSGYPNGLKGEEIPLASRIVAIGDVYDALTSRRPYKEPFSHEKSMEIIYEGRGTHFDPDIVDAFIAREDEVIRIRDEFQNDDSTSALEALTAALEEAERAAAESESRRPAAHAAQA